VLRRTGLGQGGGQTPSQRDRDCWPEAVETFCVSGPGRAPAASEFPGHFHRRLAGSGGHSLVSPALFRARPRLGDKPVTPTVTPYAVTLLQWRSVPGGRNVHPPGCAEAAPSCTAGLGS